MNRQSEFDTAEDPDLLERLLAEEGIELSPPQIISARENVAGTCLSLAQQRLWALHQMYPASTAAYNILIAVRLSGELNVGALEASLNEIARRHSVLRSCFESELGVPRIRIRPSMDLQIWIVDLQCEDERAREEAVRHHIATEAGHEFDLERGPLVRASILQLAEREHVAVLNVHHLVADAWSMGILVHELGQLYCAFVEGRPSLLSELSIQYGDFAEWQRAELNTGRLEDQLAWWRKQLADAVPLELHLDHARSVDRPSTAIVHPFTVPESVVQSLERIGHEEGATLFMTALAAFQLLLFRYTAQSDIVVGTPVANRNRRDIEPLIGFFVNSLALRTVFDDNLTFRSLVRRVRDTALDAYSNSDIPFERVVQEVMPEREAGRNPLFEVMFSLEIGDELDAGFPELKVTPIAVTGSVAKFDIVCALTRTSAGLTGGFEYNSSLFEDSSIGRMTDAFSQVLSAVAEDPDISVASVPIVSEAEKQQVVVKWNRTSRDYPANTSAVAVFEESVRTSPEATAVEFSDSKITYRELSERANRIAHRLQSLGVTHETCVGVCLTPGVDLVAGILGIVKAGGAYVPLSPADPPARLRAIAKEARLPVIVTDSRVNGFLPGDVAQLLCLDTDSGVADCSSANPECATTGESIAYIIYTSGSTGEPKGIAVPHRAILRLMLNTDYVQLRPSDRIAQASAFTFDAITFELWGALLNGACLIGMTREVALSPERLSTFLEEKQISTLFLTTALFNAIARHNPTAFAPLRQLLFGGEAVDPSRVREVLNARPPQRLLHVYGPTESTTFATWFEVTDVPVGATTVPIGRPIANTKAYVLDCHMQPVPVGVPGELYLGGDGLARGYWEQPERTAERFRPDPFGERPGSRLYKTGDWVKRLPTGDIEFLNRVDHQVKIRGFRIELAEIEAALVRHPEVEAAVVVVHGESSHRRLVAYVVTAGNLEIIPAVLRKWISETLPDYMVPSHFVRLDHMPMTTGGKINRKALPAPDVSAATVSTYEPPTTEAEQVLVDVLQQVLGCLRVGMADNYFAIGGDSISAIQVVSRLRRLGWKLEVSDIIRWPVIADTARRLDRVVTQARSGPVSGPVSLAPIQHWFFANHSADLHHFNHAVLLRPAARLQPAVVRDVTAAIQRHHDALRMTYRVSGISVEQINDGLDHPLSFEAADLRTAIDEPSAMETHASAVQASLNLDRGPLLKTVLYHLTDGDRLLLVVHHLVIDLVSWRILLEDLETAFRQRASGAAIDLGVKSDAFQAWTDEVRRFSGSPELLSEIDYWSERVASASEQPPRVVSRFATSGAAQLTLSEEETRTLLTGVHHAWNTEISDILLTALARALKRWKGATRNWITLEGHGREPLGRSLDLGRTVGWFTSLFPFLLEAEGDDPGRQIRHMKESLRQVPRKGVGYGILRYITRPELRGNLDLEIHPAISFNYGGQFASTEAAGFFSLAGESCGTAVSPRLERLHEIDISAMVVESRMDVTAVYDRTRHGPEEIENFLAILQAELRTVAAQCTSREESEKTPADFGIRGLSLAAYSELIEANGWKASQIDDIYALSPMQEGLLFERLYDQTSAVYSIQTTCGVEGRLDPEIFERSWVEVCRRHAALRTAFVHQSVTRPLQVVLRDRLPAIETEDLRGLSASEQQRRVATHQERNLARPFDLVKDPLLRITLLRLSDTSSKVIWTYSHLILDGWCVGIVYGEFLRIFEAFSRGERAALPPAPRYRDYIDWLAARDYDLARAYWTEYLAGYDQPVSPRIGAAEFTNSAVSRTLSFELPLPVCQRIRQLGSDLSVTTSTVLQTAWGLVLSRYNDVRDVVFGTVVSGRPPELPGVEETVGVFINAVPVRIRFDRGEKVRDVLRAVQSSSLESEQWQHLQLADILSGTTCGRDLLDHLLVFENYPVASQLSTRDAIQPALQVTSLDAHDKTHYDLDVVIVPGERIEIQLEYSTRSYEREQIECLGGHFQRAIEALTEDLDARVDDIDILPAEERKAILEQFNGTARRYQTSGNVIDLISQQAITRPNALAVSDLTRNLTYRELLDEVDRLARTLAARGVGPEIRVGICHSRSVQTVVSMLAVLKAGGAYIPLEPQSPPERLRFIISDSAPAFVIADDDWNPAFDIEAEVVRGSTADGNHARLRQNPFSSSLAYITYTSGTTGRPKGVMVEHGSLLNGAFAWREYYGLDTLDVRMLQLAPFTADVFAGDVIRCLTNGGELVICPSDVRGDPGALHELIASKRINVLESTPALLLLLMDYIHDNGLDFSFFKLLIFGSDTLAASDYRRLRERCGPAIRIVNSYGVTEAAIESSDYDETAPSECNGATPIGKPLPNTRYYILDSFGRPVPVGVSGELYIGGPGVARGYAGRPELTAERFVPHPFRSGERMYRTGDVVRWLSDGNVQFVGRNDRQVKIRGYRVELGEIESCLLRHEAVKQAALRAREVGNGDRELIAYVVLTPAGVTTRDTSGSATLCGGLQRFVAERLPEYMVPACILLLDTIPVSANGKVDVRGLPDPDATRTQPTIAAAAEAGASTSSSAFYLGQGVDSDRQSVLRCIWEDVLRARDTRPETNFFQSGGHSLKAMQIVSRVYRELGIRISLRDFFAEPTFGGLIELVRDGAPDSYSVIAEAPHAEYYDLSHEQHRIWLLHQMGGAAAYNMAEAHVFEDGLDVDAMTRAFNTVIQRHEILRTAFVVINGEPRQKVCPELPFFIEEIDLRDSGTPVEQARSIMDRQVSQEFRLNEPPLLRATALRIDDSNWLFLLVMHHIVGDGWSSIVLEREIFTLYTAYLRGLPNPLKDLRLQYTDYVAWQQSRTFDRERSYWRKKMTPAPEPLRLPYDVHGRGERTFAGNAESIELESEVTAGLRSIATRANTTLSNVMLALVNVLLLQITGQQDLCVGMSVANRNHPDLEDLMGFFVNILPIRIRLSEDMEFEDLLKQVTQVTSEALEYQELPFDLLIRDLNPARYLSRQPIINVIFGFQTLEISSDDPEHDANVQRAAQCQTSLSQLEFSYRTSKFDLTFLVSDQGGVVRLTIEYDIALFNRETIRSYIMLLAEAVQSAAMAVTGEAS